MELLEIKRHSLSHIMAYAAKELFGDIHFGVGPAIENGFYYDLDFLNAKVELQDLAKIENKMREIINKKLDFKREDISKAEAKKLFKTQPYKLELIAGLEGDTVAIYTVGDFVDLCKGPHVNNTSELKGMGIKLHKLSGAYFKGDQNNKMLTRIYGYAFNSEKELKEYLNQLEEALKRDHVKLGKELKYFTQVDYIGKGLPILLPKGSRVVQGLQRFVEDEEQRRGYLLTKTPLFAKSDLYKISGHWDHYQDSMFIFGDEKKGEEVFALRPMTCPFQYQVFLNEPRSYRDLPMRLGETSTLFRNESSGEMHGLIRVRQFTISEGHIICRENQVEDEFAECLKLAKYMLTCVGLIEDVTFRLSKWDENDKAKYIGDKASWERAQNKMREILHHQGIEFTEADGEAAFYGPKLDIQYKSVHGKEDTLITIQLDFALAEKFGMLYTDETGAKRMPYIIHRTSLGCYERTLAYLIEKYAGALPFWIMATQVGVVPINAEVEPYAKEIYNKLIAANIRAEFQNGEAGFGAKLNENRKQKVPFSLIVGAKEMESKTISIKSRNGKQINNISLDKFIKVCRDMIDNCKIELTEDF